MRCTITHFQFNDSSVSVPFRRTCLAIISICCCRCSPPFSWIFPGLAPDTMGRAAFRCLRDLPVFHLADREDTGCHPCSCWSLDFTSRHIGRSEFRLSRLAVWQPRLAPLVFSDCGTSSAAAMAHVYADSIRAQENMSLWMVLRCNRCRCWYYRDPRYYAPLLLQSLIAGGWFYARKAPGGSGCAGGVLSRFRYSVLGKDIASALKTIVTDPATVIRTLFTDHLPVPGFRPGIKRVLVHIPVVREPGS